MGRYVWKVLSNNKIQKNRNKISELIDCILENRGIKSKKQKQEFLRPVDPNKLQLGDLDIDQKSIDKVIKRIKYATTNSDSIVIYGDYDADGICSSAILWECLYQYTKNVTPHIPDRFTEGYGINEQSVKKLIEANPKINLIITVDNGIVANDAVDYANSRGIDVIIVDHHEKSDKTPNAYSVIHSTMTSGAGLAWFLAKQIDEEYLNNSYLETLELAAIGIIADQVPLVGVNRSVVKFGIGKLRQSKRIGLRALFELAAIERANLSTYEIGYLIAPRINAMGRMAEGVDSLRLLCTKSKSRANELARKLNDTNKKRQVVVDDVVKHALKLQTETHSNSKIIVLSDESYHEGVIGLAASKLVEKFYLPAIVISKGASISKGSARSISGVSIIQMIRETGDLIIGGGGHTMAAGFSIKNENILEFTQKLNEVARVFVSDDILGKKIKIDCEIPLQMVSEEVYEAINELEPFGIGNPKPNFLTANLSISYIKKIGSGLNHLKLKLRGDDVDIDAVGFGMGEYFEEIQNSKFLQIVYTIERDTWNGRNRLQLNIKDFKQNVEST